MPKLRLGLGKLAVQLVHAFLGSPVQVAVWVVFAFQDAHEIVHAGVEVGDATADYGFGFLVLLSDVVGGGGHAGLDEGEPLGAENVVVEKPCCRFDELVFADPDRRRMVFRDVAVAWLAIGVGGAGSA